MPEVGRLPAERGAALETKLTKRLACDGLILSDLPLRFTFSKGFVIMGRDPEGERLRDFDLIRRQYAGTVDVIPMAISLGASDASSRP